MTTTVQMSGADLMRESLDGYLHEPEDPRDRGLWLEVQVDGEWQPILDILWQRRPNPDIELFLESGRTVTVAQTESLTIRRSVAANPPPA